MSTISASTTTTTAYKVTADTTGTLVLQTGATPTTAVTIDSSGNVGIGVTPTSKLDVLSASGANTIYSRVTGTTSADSAQMQCVNGSVIFQAYAYSSGAEVAVGSASNHPLTFRTNATERMRIDSSGNVGIGTNAPTQKLNVRGGRSVFQANSDLFSIQIEGGAGGGQYYIGATNEASPSLVFSNVGGAERMRIDSSGNVGIGTTTPTGGANRVVDVYGSGSSAINFHNATSGTTATDGGLVGQYGSDLVLYNYEAGIIQFATSSAERARIDSSGNLLVGTTGGSNLITATKNQSGTTAIIHATNTNNTAGNFAYQGTLGANCNTNTSAHFAGISGSSGWYLLGNGTTTYTSDSRLKKNVETARNGYLEDLCQLRVVKYNWANHDDSSPKELGLIAQEVEQVFPSLVQDDLRGEYEGVTYKTLKGSVIPMLLLKAIQELKVLTDTQASTITTLTDRIAALENK